jgi:hypothetical protein
MDASSAHRGRRAAPLVALAAFALLAAPAAARADIGFGAGLAAAPASTDAGANSKFTLRIPFTGSDAVKDLTVELPPGQVGNPLATPKCTVSQLNADSCPAATQVGTVTTNVTITVVLVPVTLDVNGSIYNLTPQPGEPARFGIVLRPVSIPPLPSVLPPVILQSAVQLRNQPVGSADFGLNTVIQNIPNTSSGLPTHINSMSVSLDGRVGGAAFIRNPTSCGTATTTFVADSYANTTATGTASYTPTNCGALDFSPAFSASIGSRGHTAAPSKPPLETVVGQDPGEADVRNAAVVLPHGISADTAVVTTSQCPLAEFTAGTCPASTVVGSVTAQSPYLSQPLRGPVSIVVPAVPGNLPRLGLDLQGPLHIQLFGSFTLGAGGAGNAFMNLPDIPLSRFVLQFVANRLVTSSRDLCTGAAPVFATSFTGWNGATLSPRVAARVNGCGPKAKPKARVAVTRAASKRPRLKLTVRDRRAKLKRAKLRLPHSLRLARGVRAFKIKGGRATAVSRHSAAFRASGHRLVARTKGGALRRTAKIAGKKLRFGLKVVDATGRTTKLKLAARARR